MKAAALCLITVLALPAVVHAQAEPKTPPTTGTTRPEPTAGTPTAIIGTSGQTYVGEHAPDFALWGSRGRELKLSRMRGEWLILCFSDSRSGFAGLIKIHGEMRALGANILGVARDKAQTLKTYAERDSVPFEMLSDVTGEVSAMYGLYDSFRSALLPGFVVIDRQGVVRLAVMGQAVPAPQIAELVRFTIVGH